MALDLTGLQAYTDENKLDLIRKSLLKGTTISLISVQPGIKSSAAINILSRTGVWQAGACGFNASGTTALTQRDLSVCSMKLNEPYCLTDLEAFYTQTTMKPGSYNEELPFAALLSDQVVADTQKFLELLAWQGDVTSGVGNMARCDGFIEIIKDLVALSPSEIIVGDSTTFSASTIVASVDAMVSAIPADMVASDDLTLFIGHAEYRMYATALRTANLFAYTGAENQGGEFTQMHPGTNVKVVGVGGLSGTGKAVLAEASNLYFGTDLENDAEMFRLRYSEDNDEVRLIAKMKAGFQIAFPERVIIGGSTW